MASHISEFSENSSGSFKYELLILQDAYTEFHHYCSLYCKSSSAIAQLNSGAFDSDCAEGMARFAQLVVEKSQEIDAQLTEVLRKA